MIRRLRASLVRFAGLVGLRRRDAELAEELEAHVAMHVEDNVRLGMDPMEARRQALMKLGGVTQSRELYRNQARLPLVETLWKDLRYGARVLRKNPGYTIVAIITLALGIGANTAIFSVVNTVMLRPLSYPNADRLVLLSEEARVPGRVDPMSVSWQDYLDWRRQARSFEYLGVYRNQGVNLTGTDRAERLNGAMVSADVLNALGIRPLLGRTFVAKEDEAGTAPVAILSERLWRNRFAAAPDILNRTITLDGTNHTVIGVMPASMRFPSRTTEVWVPLGMYVNMMPTSRDNHPGLLALGLLAPNVSLEQARSEMDTIAERLGQQYPDTNSAVHVLTTSLYETVVSGIRTSLLVLLGAVMFVLLIACVNLANMTLARGESRLRELAVRTSLGASRPRLMRQLLVESVLLSVIGAALGMAWAWMAIRTLVAAQPASIPRVDQIGMDANVMAFTCVLAVLVALLFGLWPSWRITSVNPHLSLKELAPAASRRSRLRPLLVIAEVSLAMVLLVGATLMFRTFSALSHVELGFAPEHVITMRLNLPPRSYNKAQWVQFYRNLIARMAALPGVEGQGVSSSAPLAFGGGESGIYADNLPTDPMKGRGPGCTFSSVSAGYFASMGIQMVKGRSFNDHDSPDSPPVIVVDEVTARTFWPNQDPIGRRVAFEFRGRTIQDPQPIWREVVGVVRTVRHYDLTSQISRVQVYVPFTQPAIWYQTLPAMTLIVRTATDPDQMVNSVRNEVAALDPALPVFSVSSMTEYVDGVLEQPRLSMGLMGSFGGLALLLAAVGIYGVLSYSVSQRTREIGIRTALGASRNDIMLFVMRQGTVLIAAGVLIGVLASLASTRLIRGLLYGVSATDAATYLLVSLVLLTVSLTATFIPARRAARIDPLEALRHE
ncbi:MAG TPA: ABC transporter permease [Candidatus Angelobacter sp.]